DHQDPGGDLRFRGTLRRDDQCVAKPEPVAHVPVVLMVRKVGVAAAVVCLATVIGEGYGLLAAPVLFRRAEVTRLVLRGGQYVGDLPGIGNVVVQARLDDQVDGLLAGDSESGRVLAVAVAHWKSFSLNRRVLCREVASLVAGAVVVVRNFDRRRPAD